MASGDPIASVIRIFRPSTNYARDDYTAALVPVFDFDDTVSETLYFLCVVGNYDNASSIKVRLPWKFTTFVGSQTCKWDVSFYRVSDDADSLEAFTFATARTVTDTEANAVGEVSFAEITYTNAQADGVQKGELFVLRVVRDAAGGTASPGDAELVFPIIEQA